MRYRVTSSLTPGVVKVRISGCEDKESGSSWSLEVEGDASLIHTIVRRFVECLPYPRSWVESSIAKISLPGGTEDRYIVSWYAGPQGSILIYTGGPGSPLTMLVDPLRGEGLVEVDKGLYLDHRLAECLSRGGRCGEVEVFQYKDSETHGIVYSVDVKGGFEPVKARVEVSSGGIIFFGDVLRRNYADTVVVRVLDAGVRIPLAALVDFARERNADLSIWVLIRVLFEGEVVVQVDMRVGERGAYSNILVRVSSSYDPELRGDLIHALLRILGCMARAADAAGVKVCWSSS